MLTTVESPAPLNPSGWTEYWEEYFGYPVVEGMSGRTLPLMTFHKSVPNGTYNVYANLDTSAYRRFRYFYSFNDAANPQARYVDVAQVEGDAEYLLGTVTVTDGQFSLYTNRTDALTGDNWYFAWCWIRLVAQ